MDTAGFLRHLQRLPWYANQIVHRQVLPPRAATWRDLTQPLAPALETVLKEAGLWPLYQHQALALDAIQQGRHVIVATPAASGKSLCYHLPVLQALSEDRKTSALYLYPTKALAQDQLRSLGQLTSKLPQKPLFETYDGDTPSEQRASIRQSAHILLTNPDMLHIGILPRHKLWSRFFTHLKYVVIDEAHIYRGVFGSHVANVLRRLRRICEFYGDQPQFILCSATVANPQELAEQLVGAPFQVVEDDGSPSGSKDFLFWNPPIVDETTMARRSSSTEATALFSELVKQDVRTLIFARSRKLVELIYLYTRGALEEQRPALASRIRPYRAGYLPEDRRKIERDLFEGRLLGVSATNALELGIDIGSLDATVLTGYPGSIASAWQQAGRSGRRGEHSLSILIGMNNPLDQYLMRHPATFFGRPVENALLSPGNPYILKSHLLCAAYELPLASSDRNLMGEDFQRMVEELAEDGRLRFRARRWFLSPALAYPAGDVSIRSASSESFNLVEEESGRLLETIDPAAAFLEVHPGAIYLHQGDSYLITRLDLESKTAFARHSAEEYYTQASEVTDIRILGTPVDREVTAARVYLGKVAVERQVVSFKRKKLFTEEVISEEALDLPTQTFPTIAFWWDIPSAALNQIRLAQLDLVGGLHAAEHTAIGVLPLFALCDRNDIGGVSTPIHPDTGQPQVFIYDGHPGGVGIAEKGFELVTELWEATLRVLKECACEAGCPSCVQSPKCGNNNKPLDKPVAAMLLEALLGPQGIRKT